MATNGSSGAGAAGQYDAVVIGGGHNGLITAAYLARAGLQTVVLERRHVLGGAAVTEEVFPGFRFSVFSYVVSLLRPEIIRELDLPRHGLDILPLDGTFTPLPEGKGRPAPKDGNGNPIGTGDYLWRVNDHGRTVRELRRWSRLDAEAYEEYGQLMVDMARFIKPILSIVPPDPASNDPRPLLPLAGLVRAFQRLSERQQAVFVQLMTMSAADFLSQWFETDPLKATMAASGIIGTFQGVRSPGTAYVLLHHYMGEIDGAFRAWGIPKNGTGGISNAIASAARANGAEIRTEAAVARIRTRGGRATGVVLENGDEIEAKDVISSLDVRRTFIDLLEPDAIDRGFADEVRRFKFRGSSGKVNLALDALPSFTALPGEGEHLRGAISISPSLDDMERAYDDAKYDRFSAKPYVDIVIPTLVDPSMAPPGKHVMSCFVQYAPYHLDPALGGWDQQREAFGDAVVNRIAEFAPDLPSKILHRQVMTPLDIERTTGLTEGNIFQGELSLEQLFFSRPVPGWARFRTPIRDLWMCGSSTHPGGGIMGANGRIAALELLRARRKRAA
jgi:phytoene dehydrogenase-like protein